MEYGSKKPNVHTMPTAYYTKSSGFTEVSFMLFSTNILLYTIYIYIYFFLKHLGKIGMCRNQGLNTGISRSKI